MSRDLDHEFKLLKEQKGELSATRYAQDLNELANAYMKRLEENGLMLIPQVVEVIA